MTSNAPSNPDHDDRRAGFIAVLGAPNVGKSTLVNTLVGSKVSIVSPKVQTTRTRVMGIVQKDRTQLIFVDTPGIFAPRRRLDRAMVAAAWAGAGDADIVVLVVDSLRGFDRDTRAIAEQLKTNKRSAVLVLNKTDAAKKDGLLQLAAQGDAMGLFTEIFMVSALTGDGTGDLLGRLAEAVPPGPWLFPEDQLSDMPERQLAAEITREKLFLALEQEVPYAATVETETWEDRPDGSVRIGQVVYVERPSQRAIVLGHGGKRIKSIGQAAREELSHILGCTVHLFLFVKVREKWGDDPERYRDWGLDFNA
jgi:GTP-binding protein Era